jgi:hypothetical protein
MVFLVSIERAAAASSLAEFAVLPVGVLSMMLIIFGAFSCATNLQLLHKNLLPLYE